MTRRSYLLEPKADLDADDGIVEVFRHIVSQRTRPSPIAQPPPPERPTLLGLDLCLMIMMMMIM